MIYIRDEGEPVRNGFNFYPRSSTNSRGVVVRLGKFALWLRYSLLRKRMFISLQTQKGLV
jgi:hypothetical protein